MSYQFEDESALEELLNQQLDRKRQLTSSQPSAKVPSIKGSDLETSGNFFSTGRSIGAISSKQTTIGEIAHSSVPKSKLASWLRENDDKKVALKLEDVGTTKLRVEEQISLDKLDETESKDHDVNKLIHETLRDEQLQDMSKQRLIKLILSQIVPVLKSLKDEGRQKSSGEIERLKREIELERDKVTVADSRRLEETNVAESRLSEAKRELELKLESKERELIDCSERYRSIRAKLEEEHRQQLASLSESYKIRLEDERKEFEETLRRRSEFHQVELESKLRVNYDVAKMETIFSEWNNMIRGTSRELELQFKCTESLLEKQTVEICGTNSDLVQKTKRLADQYDKFERQTEQLSELAQAISTLLPDLTHIQRGSKSVFEQTNKQLARLSSEADDLKAREAQLELVQLDLTEKRKQLAEEQLAWGLKWNKLECKEERIDELSKGIEKRELSLDEQNRVLQEREIKLGEWRASLDKQSVELKHSNYELHLARRALAEQERRLKAREFVLAEERAELDQIRAQITRLDNVRERARKEMDQLRRLEKSLVCSICLERLVKNDKNSKWHIRQLDLRSLEAELARSRKCTDSNDRQLKHENKYVELLTTN